MRATDDGAGSSTRRWVGLKPAALAVIALVALPAAALPGDLAPGSGDGRHGVADVVRLLAILDGAAASAEERITANLAPAAVERHACVIVRASGTGGLNGVSWRLDYDATRLVTSSAETTWNPALPALGLDSRNVQAGRLQVGSILPVNEALPLPADLHAVRFRKLDASAPDPTLSRCALSDVNGEAPPQATCSLVVVEDRRPVLKPPAESVPWLDDQDVAALVELVLSRADVPRGCWE